jgi:hypothetical protein
VHLLHEVTPQRDEEEQSENAAEQGDEEELHQVHVETEDEQGRQGEDRPRDDQAGGGADGLDDHVLENGGATAEHHAEPHGEDRDRDGGLEHLADLETEERSGRRKHDGEHDSQRDRADRELGPPIRGAHQRLVLLAGFEGAVRVLGQAST